MANATELREMLGNLTTLVTNFVSSVEADRKRAADAAAPIPTTPVTTSENPGGGARALGPK